MLAQIEVPTLERRSFAAASAFRGNNNVENPNIFWVFVLRKHRMTVLWHQKHTQVLNRKYEVRKIHHEGLLGYFLFVFGVFSHTNESSPLAVDPNAPKLRRTLLIA